MLLNSKAALVGQQRAIFNERQDDYFGSGTVAVKVIVIVIFGNDTLVPVPVTIA